jgi:hypothetical protein
MAGERPIWIVVLVVPHGTRAEVAQQKEQRGVACDAVMLEWKEIWRGGGVYIDSSAVLAGVRSSRHAGAPVTLGKRGGEVRAHPSLHLSLTFALEAPPNRRHVDATLLVCSIADSTHIWHSVESYHPPCCSKPSASQPPETERMAIHHPSARHCRASPPSLSLHCSFILTTVHPN